jgi:hypothetical protein
VLEPLLRRLMQRLRIEMEPRMAFAIDTVIAVKVIFRST